MPITDYISPTLLHQEGWVNTADTEQMFAKLDKRYLAEQGYVNMSQLRDVCLSIHKAAEVIGISSTTLLTYAKAGYLELNDQGQVPLLAALTFDYATAKRAESEKKRRMKIKR